jgi:hypothetical protein
MRLWIGLAGFAAALSACADAKGPAASHWVVSEDKGVVVHTKGGETAQSVVMMRAVVADSPEALTAVAAGAFAHMQCKDSQPAPSNGEIGPFGDHPRCFGAYAKTATGFDLAIGASFVDRDDDELMARARSLVGAEMPQAATAMTQAQPAQASETAILKAGSAPADLAAAALKAIPNAHRPVKVDFKDGHPRYFFSTGFMTNCRDFDPGLVAPTPEAFAKAGIDCELYPWRAKGAAAEYKSSGEWYEASTDDETILAFRPGERLELNWGNISAFSFPGGGPISTGTLTDGQIIMTKTGEIATAQFSSTNINVTGAVGGTWSADQPLRGAYALDGHLIAIVDDQGRASRGFFTGVGSGGSLNFVYLNGVRYYPPDEEF